MAKNNDLDEFGFEPLESEPVESSADLSEFGFEPVDVEESSITLDPEKDVSIGESVGRGALQGATLGFAEEIGAAALTPLETLRRKISSYMEGTPENVDKKLAEQGFKLPEEKGVYQELRDTARTAEKEASEANPTAYLTGEITGGIAPAILSGGAAATAKTGTAVLKGGLKEAVKEGAKVGAKYGAASGLGYSEGEDLGELVSDTASGAALGAGTGALLPIGIEGAKQTGGAAKTGIKKLLSFLPGSDDIKAGYAYGKQGKAITEEVVDEEVKQISKRILSNIKSAKEANNMDEAKKLLDQMGFKVNTKKAINEAIEDLQKIDADDILGVQNKDLLPRLQELAGKNVQEEKLIERANKSAIKKQIEAQGKQNQAIIKGEKKLAQEAFKSNKELEQIQDISRQMDDLEIPFDTSQGKFSGTKGTFKERIVTPEGEEKVIRTTKNIIDDTTDFQPVISKGLGVSGRPVVTTKDLGSGKINALVGNIDNKIQRDLSKMSIDEVESLRKQLNVVTDLAKAQGTQNDPVMGRARELAVELKRLTDQAVEAVGSDDLVQRRARFSDIFAAEDLLGINKRFAARSDINQELAENALGGKLAFAKGFGSRQEQQKATELLGEDIISGTDKQQLDLLKKINKIMGREEAADNISRAGLYKKATADLPNVVGRAVRQVEKITSPVKQASQSIANMPKEQLASFASKLQTSENKGMQSLGNRIAEAASKEGTAQHQAIWSLSQNPAFRELIRRHTIESDKELNSLMESDSEPDMEFSEPIREPSSEQIENPVTNTENNDMAVKNIDEAFDHILDIEAGYQNNVNDKGNFTEANVNIGTNRGITPDAYRAYYGQYPTVEEMKALSKEQALEIYKENYFKKPKFDLIEDPNLQAAVVDFGVNSGTTRAIKALQSLVGSKPDGLMGPDTIDKINNYQGDVLADFYNIRRNFIEEIVEKNPQNEVFQKGWQNRINKMEEVTAPEESTENIEQKVQEAENAIDRVNRQQGSGEVTPVDQLEDLLGKINQLKAKPEEIDELENEAIQMESFADGERLKDKIRKLQGLS